MESLLYDAARNGDLSKLEHLTASNPSTLLGISRPKKESVLHVVAATDNYASAKFICTRCPELIGKRNSKSDSAFHIAARAGKIEILKILIQACKEPDLEAGNDHVDGHGDDERQVQGRSDATRRRSKALLKLKNKDGNTVLHETVRRGDLQMFKLLVDEEPQLVNYANGTQETPLYLAAARGQLKIVQKILQLISEGRITSIDCKGPDRQNALHVATARGHTEIAIELVMKLKWLLKEKDNAGRTPLHYAASFGRVNLCLHFLKTESSCVYFRDKDGHAPIHLAASEGHNEIISQLTESFSDAKDLLNRQDQNVLHIAAKYGKVKVVKFLLRGSKFELLINEKDKGGNTPLHLATRHWHLNIVSFLTTHKRVDMSITNKEGLTALDVAQKYIDTPASFRKLITLAALKAADAPSSQNRVVVIEDYKVDSMVEDKVAHGAIGKNQLGNKIMEDKKWSPMLEDTVKVGFYKDRVNTFILVATLIATVTFAAGFTMPGGYNSDGPDKGMAILLSNPSLYVCIICNTLAMYTSIIIIVTLMWAQTTNLNSLTFALQLCSPILGFALTSMAIAFTTGLYSVVSKIRWFATIVLAMGFIFIICISCLFFALHILLWSKYPRLLFLSRHFVRFLAFFISDDD